MSQAVPTYVNCSRCGHMARGTKLVPRDSGHEQGEKFDGGEARVLAAWVNDPVVPGHRRPVCSECAWQRKKVAT